MNTSRDGGLSLEQFDRVMSLLLRESVRGEEPSDKVRGRLLRAAAAVRQQPIHPYYEVI